MKAKATKSSGKGKPATKRGVKDLPPGKTQNVKGSKARFRDFNFTHQVDKSSPILL